MIDNRPELDRLFAEQQIALVRGPVMDSTPPPLPSPMEWDRVEGMMLGLAIGDALGNTDEGRLPADRMRAYGEIRNYLPNAHADYRSVGLPTDDTQLAFWTLEQLLADGGLDPDHLAQRFCAQRIFGIGSAVREFIRAYQGGVRPWYRCGSHSAGNGALMRIAPVLIPHLVSGDASLWADAALAAMVTHNDAMSTSACVAWVSMLWTLLGMSTSPEPEWWPATYVAVARELEGQTNMTPRGGVYADFRGPLWRFVSERVTDAYARGLDSRQACDEWYSGAFVGETVPSVLYILMRYGHDPEEALVRAVNDTKDNDTVAAIVGSAVGALHGRKGLPERWVANLIGRTAEDDDGRIFDLLVQARKAFGPHP